jgi:hypothetical protein
VDLALEVNSGSQKNVNSTAEHFRNEIFTTRCLAWTIVSVGLRLYIEEQRGICVGMFAASRAESYSYA